MDPLDRRRRTKTVARFCGLLLLGVAVVVLDFGSTDVGRRRMEYVDTCSIPKPEPVDIEPVVTASYPGSGAKLTWKLLRAITGIMTGDDLNHNGLVSQGKVVSIKTHYPSHGEESLFEPYKSVSRAILLLRNPLTAIPSYHNYEYEARMNLPNHSTRAPIDEWIKWRDENFEIELNLWRTHVFYWMSKYSARDRLLVSYERLISSDAGPTELENIRAFLEPNFYPILKHKGTATAEEIPCLWDLVVNKREDRGTRRDSLRKGGPVKEGEHYPFTEKQLDRLIGVLDELTLRWPKQLSALFGQYKKEIIAARSESKMDEEKERLVEKAESNPEIWKQAPAAADSQMDEDVARKMRQYLENTHFQNINS